MMGRLKGYMVQVGTGGDGLLKKWVFKWGELCYY
jgi:hypothetical protein